MNAQGHPASCTRRERWQDRIIVGVTGHRLLSREDSVADGVEQAFRQIELAYGARPLTVLSPLAYGADQLVARRALVYPGAELVVPLPMPLEEYLHDFPAGASRDSFLELLGQAVEVVNLTAAATRVEAYAAVGRFIVEHSDVLIAVWDGKPARGQGGTGQVVAEARHRGLPLAWILSENRARRTAYRLSPRSEEGTVRFERFPARSQDR